MNGIRIVNGGQISLLHVRTNVGKSKYKLLARYTIYSSIRMINALKKDIRGISCFSSK